MQTCAYKSMGAINFCNHGSNNRISVRAGRRSAWDALNRTGTPKITFASPLSFGAFGDNGLGIAS